MTFISDQVTEELQRIADQEADDDEGPPDDEHNRLDLNKMFTVGQYLRTSVVSTGEELTSGAQGKRHIELSIKPQQANAGLKAADLVENHMVQSTVRSMEDHGIIMDLGLEDADVRGFVSKGELGQERDIAGIREGSVFLCMVIGKSSNGRIIKLSLDPHRISNINKGAFVADAPSVDSFLPGTAVDVLVSEVDHSGVCGKVMGLLDVTTDTIHSGAASSNKDLAKKYPVGKKVKGRILCTFPTSEQRKLGVSFQDHIVNWRSKFVTETSEDAARLPTSVLAISSILDQAKVAKVDPGSGLFLDVGVKGARGFAHISMLSDSRVDTLSELNGAYKIGSLHQARVMGFNSIDGLFILSLKPSVIDQPFLRVQDVKVGQLVKATIQKLLIGPDGVTAIILDLAKGITGLVPDLHFADVRLQHPERKFREGMAVTARVLSVDVQSGHIRLTMKKSLVNSDAEPWTDYGSLKIGMQSPGTLMNILANGAVVHFYGKIRAFLPISEMSEAFIQDPHEHFHRGQTVNVHVTSVDPEKEKMTVSCKVHSTVGQTEKEARHALTVGERVSGTVTEKSQDNIIVELEGSGLKTALHPEHLTDGSAGKAEMAAKKIRVGQTLKNLMVLSNSDTLRLVRMTSKSSLVKAAEEGKLPSSIRDITQRMEVSGYVKNITPTAVFVGLGGELTGLLLKQHLDDEAMMLPDFGFRRNQSITSHVLSVDHGQGKFLLTTREQEESGKDSMLNRKSTGTNDDTLLDTQLSNPVDGTSTSTEDFSIGKITAAKIVSIKETQMNMLLADGVQGRLDVSEIFDSMQEVSDRKHPLKKFHPKSILPVRILGMHDTRNHRFLPITHRSRRGAVFELTAKPSSLKADGLDVLTINKVKVGSQWLVAVNNITEDCLWVNLSPNVRGRIKAMDVSDDISLLRDLAAAFPVGSVLKAKVLKVDIETNHLDLTARASGSSATLTLQDVNTGMVLPGRVTKVTDHQVMVQLSESLAGAVHLVDIADDYSKANPHAFEKNQTVRVCVRDIDKPNKRIALSTRPSKILSSTLPVKDGEITSIPQLAVNDIVRGFIKNVADSGIFVSLAINITAFVRVSDLSDAFIKDWKAGFEIDQLIEGKIIALDPAVNHVQMSLKRSHIDKDYKPPLIFTDMEVGQTVTGRIRKVEDFGVFVVVDNSSNVSGLCHRTKLSDTNANPKKLFEEGDAVKAKILNINTEKRQISFGLKPSYFEKDEEQEDGSDVDANDHEMRVGSDASDSDDGGAKLNGHLPDQEDAEAEDNMDVDHEADLNSTQDPDEAEQQIITQPKSQDPTSTNTPSFPGLSTGKFDWTGGMETFSPPSNPSDTESASYQPTTHKKKKKRNPTIQTDLTGTLDATSPQTPSDFERLLLTHSSSSHLWLQYIAHHLSTLSIPTARATAERALKSIPAASTDEKLNIHLALLNLELHYGSPDTLANAFDRACSYNDPQTVHERMTAIYIAAGHFEKADELFQTALKKFGKESSELWFNHATFLFTKAAAPERARAVLPKAMQTFPEHMHVSLSSKFAQLEFKYGDPERGRTLFETLLAKWPKRLDLWSVWLDMEIGYGSKGDNGTVRRLFERVTAASGNLKPKKAKFFFKRWVEFEEGVGEGGEVERVKGLAGQYVRRVRDTVDA